VAEGNLVITSGWRTLGFESLYPRGIPIGVVESVGQQDVDLYKRIQIAPLVDFDSLAEVIVLKEIPQAAKPAAKPQQNAKPQKKSSQNGKKTRP
jgi:cell shape-determining protein MreC